MSKGSEFLAEFEREWFTEAGIDPTPEDVEFFRGSALYARARIQGELLDLADSLTPLQRSLVRIAAGITRLATRLRYGSTH